MVLVMKEVGMVEDQDKVVYLVVVEVEHQIFVMVAHLLAIERL